MYFSQLSAQRFELKLEEYIALSFTEKNSMVTLKFAVNSTIGQIIATF